MICIHGLDDINCPTCRKLKATVPSNLIDRNKLYDNELKPHNLHYKQHISEKDEFLKEIVPNKGNFKAFSINPFSKPKLLNPTPNFENKMFSERLKEIEISKSDIFGISKKISLESPEFKLKKEE